MSTFDERWPQLHVGSTHVAHESADPTVISHCPRCGSGAVIAHSDGNTHCKYCDLSFSVKAQPEFSAFPQTDPVTGEPIDVPGVDGLTDPNAATDPMDPDAAPEADDDADELQDPDALDGDGAPPADDAPADDDKDENPFAPKKSYLTAQGVRVDLDSYLTHLNFQLSPTRQQAIAALRKVP